LVVDPFVAPHEYPKTGQWGVSGGHLPRKFVARKFASDFGIWRFGRIGRLASPAAEATSPGRDAPYAVA
jgi:hypothetical protein